MTTAERLREAHAEAQNAFHVMLEAGTFGDPDHPLTRFYIEAERHVDTVLEYAQWERAKAEMDALIASDIIGDPALALGDHFAFPNGVGR